MTNIMRSVDTAIHWIEDVVSAFSLAAIVAIAAANTVDRYIFASGFLWADEVNQALLVAMAMFGSARAFRTGGHIEFSTVSNLPKSHAVRMGLRAFILLLTVIFLVFLFIICAQYTSRGTILSTVLKVPRMYYYVSMPIGFGLCIYELVRMAKHKIVDDPVQDGNQ
ncbi:MAG: TRAP transporter small permease subunit [Proteobacteria bacterium]|uniref:TRAP transporter small permease protein n=1 Tax=Candidatus Avisuccinivibrio stercorigallinarum TaxID=2840704 RepID=A0A9D9GTX2_9GAMM|nr:TRAP transporter small permease subunit [Candidatus Avisuccinivibrio stercorigallinarum]